MSKNEELKQLIEQVQKQKQGIVTLDAGYNVKRLFDDEGMGTDTLVPYIKVVYEPTKYQ